MSRTDPQFNLRIPAELKAKVEEAAKLNKRSATAEIIARIEETFVRDDDAYYQAADNHGNVKELTKPEVAAVLEQMQMLITQAVAKAKGRTD